MAKSKKTPGRAEPAYSMAEMKRLLEAVLFAADKPVPLNVLSGVLAHAPHETVREALARLGREYEETGRSFLLKEVGGGFLLMTHPAYEPWIRRLFRGRLTLRLSKSALETIAIIAYRQPVSKQDIETIRGVNADGVLNTLLDRRLIRVTGRKEGAGRALLYGTSPEFLTYMGLKDLTDLPQLEEMKAIMDTHEPFPGSGAEDGVAQPPAEANGSQAPAPGEAPVATTDAPESPGERGASPPVEPESPPTGESPPPADAATGEEPS